MFDEKQKFFVITLYNSQVVYCVYTPQTEGLIKFAEPEENLYLNLLDEQEVCIKGKSISGYQIASMEGLRKTHMINEYIQRYVFTEEKRNV